MIGGTSEHRLNLLKLLENNGLKCFNIRSFGEERDRKINKCKIIINSHYVPESNILETIRCYPILFHKIIVVSEKSIYDKNIKLNDSIIFCDYNQVLSKVKEVLENYEKFQKLCFDNSHFGEYIEYQNSCILKLKRKDIFK
jgi:hypothetical protein